MQSLHLFIEKMKKELEFLKMNKGLEKWAIAKVALIGTLF